MGNRKGENMYMICDKTTGRVYGVYQTEVEAAPHLTALIQRFVDQQRPRYHADANDEITQQQIQLLLKAIAEKRFEIRCGEITWLPKAG